MQTSFFRPFGLSPAGVVGLFALLVSPFARAEQVLCHYTYGGETKTLVALPVASPYAVKAIDIGSFFHLRVVFQDRPAAIASIKTYVYGDRDDDPLLIQQATFPYPSASRAGAPYGFSGRQWVYEPMRDGELEYWCELTPTRRSARRVAR